jgi:antitoxin HicB
MLVSPIGKRGLRDVVRPVDRTGAAAQKMEVIPLLYRVPLLFSPQPEGGFTVTSPVLPELVTEGDTLDEAFANAQDALAAVIELYADDRRSLPAGVALPASGEVVWSDALLEAS